MRSLFQSPSGLLLTLLVSCLVIVKVLSDIKEIYQQHQIKSSNSVRYNPRISIVIKVSNRSVVNLLKQLRDTYPELEIVIKLNSKSLRLKKILSNFRRQQSFSKYRIISKVERLNIKKFIRKYCSGEYVVVCNGDDHINTNILSLVSRLHNSDHLDAVSFDIAPKAKTESLITALVISHWQIQSYLKSIFKPTFLSSHTLLAGVIYRRSSLIKQSFKFTHMNLVGMVRPVRKVSHKIAKPKKPLKNVALLLIMLSIIFIILVLTYQLEGVKQLVLVANTFIIWGVILGYLARPKNTLMSISDRISYVLLAPIAIIIPLPRFRFN